MVRIPSRRVAIDECGDFAHRIDGPVLGRVLLAGLDVNDDPLVLCFEFLEHPVGSHGPAHRVEVVLHVHPVRSLVPRVPPNSE